jgi:hypothetical protein
VFAYDPSQIAARVRSIQDKRLPAGPTIVGVNGSRPGSKPSLAPSYVNISGNFGGVFYVSGVGSAPSQMQTNTVNITTNRSLTFTTNSFKPLTLGQNSAESMGKVTYTMAIYQGNSGHMGALVAGPIGGTDAGFNGQTLSLGASPGQTNESYVLVISRLLTMSGQATGACMLVGTGYIGVTIN